MGIKRGGQILFHFASVKLNQYFYSLKFQLNVEYCNR
jgi:hypothetical protein